MGSRLGPCRGCVLALLSMPPLARSAPAGTLDVPAQYATIQSAIDAAQPGDTVLVAPGTYVERIDFLGKAITVASSGGAEVTTIDGNRGGTVVSFQTHETPASILQGFTITGGTGSLYGVHAQSVGGGVLIDGASPVVRDCFVTGNTAAHFGGGVYVVHTGLGHPALLEHCSLTNNSTTATEQSGGGGLAVDHGAAVIVHLCSLISNTSATLGGGFYVHRNSKARIASTLIAANTAAGPGGGGRFSSSQGNSFASFELTECYVFANSGLSGGGLSVAINQGFQSPLAHVRRCRFEANHASLVGGGAAGGTDSDDGLWFRDCVFTANTAVVSGGAVEARRFVHVVLCTLAGNEAPLGGALNASAETDLSHCIVWSNSVPQLTGPIGAPEWCDIEGGPAGLGNIDIEPFFVDEAQGDVHLAPTSACIDAGDPAWFPTGKDSDGDPRVLFGRVDIGADESTVPAGPWTFLGHALAGASGKPSLAGDGTLVGGEPLTLALGGAAPNKPAWLVVGASQILMPLKGGVLVPAPDLLIGPFGTGPAGGLAFGIAWPNGIPAGFVVSLQSWITDASGPAGFAATNGLAAESQ